MSFSSVIKRQWHRQIKRVIFVSRLIARPFAIAYVSTEFLVLILRHARDIRRMPFVYSMWFWSFGHQATDLHMLSLRFPEKDVLVLISDYRNFNRYLTDSFRSRVSLRYLSHTRLMEFCWKHVLGIWPTVRLKQALLRFFIRLIGAHAVVIKEFCETRRSQVSGLYLTDYMDLMKGSAHPFLTPDPEPVAAFRALLTPTQRDTLSSRWLVSVYLRHKRQGSTDVRDCDAASYKMAVEWLLDQGAVIFCGADFTADDIAPGREHVWSYRDFPCDRTLTDYFFLTQCRFLFAAHSGPLPISTAFGLPVLITNNAFYYLSGYLPSHRLLNKKLTDQKTGRVLSAPELFSHPVVAYADKSHFDRAGLVHIDNTPEELLDAVQEMTALVLHGTDNMTDADRALEERYRSLMPSDAVARQTPARPTVEYLRSLQWE